MSTNVTLTREEYVDLLIKAGVTETEAWPDGAKHGAPALARLREIEAACVAAHGAFDWERLDEVTQDEYDSLSGQLDLLRYAGTPQDNLSWEDYLASRKERGL